MTKVCWLAFWFRYFLCFSKNWRVFTEGRRRELAFLTFYLEFIIPAEGCQSQSIKVITSIKVLFLKCTCSRGQGNPTPNTKYWSHWEHIQMVFSDRKTYRFLQVDPLVEFGFGLSYSQFICSNLSITPEISNRFTTRTLTWTLSNRGPYDGHYPLFWYFWAINKHNPKKNLNNLENGFWSQCNHCKFRSI